MKELTLPVVGMGCPHCTKKIDKSVTALSGVNRSTTSLTEATLTVSFDEKIIGIDALRRAVKEAGYDLELRQLDPLASAPQPTHDCP